MSVILAGYSFFSGSIIGLMLWPTTVKMEIAYLTLVLAMIYIIWGLFYEEE